MVPSTQDTKPIANSPGNRTEALFRRIGTSVRLSKLVAHLNSLASKPAVGFLFALLLLISRRPQAILNPTFYIEDGPEYFQNAFNLGVPSLTHVYAGYFHAIPRLIALLATLFPLRNAPLVMTSAALLIQAGSAAFLLSDRLSAQIPSRAVRAAMAFLVVAYPNSDELFGNTSHSQWFLLVLAVALLSAEPGKSWASRAVEYVVVAMISLTGPFALALAPFGFLVSRRNPHRLIMSVILSLGAGATVMAMATHPRFDQPGRADFTKLVHMFSGQVVVGATRGLSGVQHYRYSFFLDYGELTIAVLALLILGWGFVKGSQLLKGLIYLGTVTFVAALRSGATWLGLATAGQGERYFFILGLALLLCVLQLALSSMPKPVRFGAAAILLLTAASLIGNWRYGFLRDGYDYDRQVSAFESLPPGSHFDFRTAGDQASARGWVMTLQKRGPAPSPSP